MHSSRLPKATLTATATSTGTATSVATSVVVSQPGLAVGQRQQEGSFVGFSTTVHTPEPTTPIPTADQPFAGPRLSANASASQVDPFQALASHQTVSFDNDHPEQPDNSSSQSKGSLAKIGESSQPIVDAAPNVKEAPFEVIVTVLSAKDVGDSRIRIMTTVPNHEILPSIKNHFRRALSGIVPEALVSLITGDPRFVTGQLIADRKPDPTDKWIVLTGDKNKPFKCGYEGCDKQYIRKQSLQAHFISHTGISRYRCYLGECTGKIALSSQFSLNRHIRAKHTNERPYRCHICDKRFRQNEHLKYHLVHMHSTKAVTKSPNCKRK